MDKTIGDKTAGWTVEDFYAGWMAAMIGAVAFAFRLLAVSPVATVGQCAAARPPAFCAPRQLVLTAGYLGLFGWAALALGLVAFFRPGRFTGALAVGLGIAAVVNYNGTEGIVGAALGLIAWLSVTTGRLRGKAA